MRCIFAAIAHVYAHKPLTHDSVLAINRALISPILQTTSKRLAIRHRLTHGGRKDEALSQ
jgi:hypothetical protein